jgi:hypothetical protein
MNTRLPRADKRLILPGIRRAVTPTEETTTVVLPGDDTEPPSDEKQKESWTPTVFFEETVREVTATTLAEEHQGVKQVTRSCRPRTGLRTGAAAGRRLPSRPTSCGHRMAVSLE